MRIFISESAEETRKIAGGFAKKCLNSKLRTKALVIGLTGELGAGKTVFIQGFAKALGVKKRVVSPTFVIIRHYKNLFHIDAYRIKKPKEIVDLGWKELINNPQNIILIEWAEKIKNILPKNYIKIKFEHVDRNKRKISFVG